MHFGLSTRCFRAQSLTVDLLERVRRAEFNRIEIYGNPANFDFHNRSLIRSVGRWFEENELPSPSIHLPYEEPWSRDENRPISPLHPDHMVRAHFMDEMKRCMELAERIPIEYAVLHLGEAGQPFSPVDFEHAYAAISGIQSFAGVRVLIENIGNEISAISRVREFVAVAQLSNVGICYDVGHAHIAEAAMPDGKTDDITAMHLHDNDGFHDTHLWPFSGTRNWPKFVENLDMLEYSGTLILEPSDDRFDKAHDCRSRLQDLRDEAANSLEEFRLKYRLPSPKTEEEDD